jgi:hypothetical protein
VLNRAWLKAFLPVGVVGREEQGVAWKPVGAATLFNGGDVLWLVTAAHVVRQNTAAPIVVVAPSKSGDPQAIDISSTQAQTGTRWVFAPEHDVAATLMPHGPDLDIAAVERKLCLRAADAIPSMPAYTIGCPYGLTVPSRPVPLVQDGIIAGVDEANGGRLVYTTAPVFPGNSGGPLVVVRVPFSPGGHLVVGGATVLFAGVVIGYAVHRRLATAVPAELPALHLGIAVAADVVLDLLESPAAREQVEIARRQSASAEADR